MLKILSKKLTQGVLMILIVSAVTFALLSAAGGDALSALRENPQISEQTIENLRRVYGLDQPLTTRYVSWLGGALTGDLGDSLYFRVPVSGLIWSRFLNTLQLAAIAIVFSLLISVSLAYLSVRYRSRTLDAFIETVILVTSATPRIVLALVALSLTVWLYGSMFNVQSGSAGAKLLASFVLGLPLVALFLGQGHKALASAMDEDFVKFARAKGLSERVVILRHASRAALNPVITIFGLSLGGLLGGSVIVEMVLGWPGLGALMVTAVRGRDVPLVMGVVLISSFAVWLANAAGEILQVINDRRLTSN